MLIPTFQSWDVFFRNATAGAAPGEAYVSPYNLPAGAFQGSGAAAAPHIGAQQGSALDLKVIDDHLAVQAIIRSYQVRLNKKAAAFLTQLSIH